MDLKSVHVQWIMHYWFHFDKPCTHPFWTGGKTSGTKGRRTDGLEQNYIPPPSAEGNYTRSSNSRRHLALIQHLPTGLKYAVQPTPNLTLLRMIIKQNFKRIRTSSFCICTKLCTSPSTQYFHLSSIWCKIPPNNRGMITWCEIMSLQNCACADVIRRCC